MMKRFCLSLLALSLALTWGCAGSHSDFKALPPPTGTTSAASPAPAPAAPAEPAPAPDPDAWPRTIKRDTTTYTIYQPQLDAWDGLTLDARAAVAVQAADAKEPTYGIIFLHSGTAVDREERLVHFENLTVTKTRFPSLKDPEAFLDRFQSFIPKDIKDIDLDRLEASLAIVEARSRPVQLLNAPPAILFATQPTMLVPVDGEPRWTAVGETGLARIVNTRSLILRDALGAIYLHLYDGYVTAHSLAGPWTPALVVPPAVDQAKDLLVIAKQVDLLAGQPDPTTQVNPTLAAKGVPNLRITTVPTELVVTEGEPKWTPIPETQLLFIANTPSHVFRDLADQQLYLLLSGRWFKAAGAAGPWTYVPGQALPGDFAKIPDASPKENAKASVPGTRQAEEALIANSIPTTTKMDRKTAKLEPLPAYDGGGAILAAIDGTSLMYAVNTATPVIRVDEQNWYACQNGVWFTAATANGPWLIAPSVPAAIYAIPASSPLYYVTYVRVFRANDDYVWVGYTPGYYGTVVSADGTVVYGTGYVHAPYVTDTIYVAYPTTYGYSSSLAWTPWSGWAFGFAVGYAWEASWSYWACMPPAPYWGPYWGYCYGWGYNAMGGITAWGPYGWVGTSGNIYSQNGPWSGVSRYQGGFNAWTGNRWASQYGRAYNSVTGTRAVGQRGAVANIYTGGYAYGARGGAVNENTGNAVWGARGTIGNAGTGNEISGARGGIYNNETGEVTRYGGVRGENGGVAHIGDDVYAGHDGNVYKKTDGGWEQMNGNRPTPSDASSLDREYGARQLGSQRASSYQYSRPAFRGGGGRRR
jgi:hypothetical protein